MRNLINKQLIRVSKLVLIAITMVFVSCSTKEEDVPVEEQSITAANFESISSYSDNGYTNIELGDVTNNSFSPIIKVENYMSSFNYSIVIKGDYLENEYKVDLVFDKINDEGDTILKFDMAAFDAVPDSYQAYIFEEESNSEIKIENKPDQGERPYYIYDADNSEYLYDLYFKSSDSNYTLPSSINIFKNFYLGYNPFVNFSSGLDLKLVVYDRALNNMGSVDIRYTGSATNVVDGSDLSFITESGDYIFQIVGTPKEAGGEYTARKSTFKKMKVYVIQS